MKKLLARNPYIITAASLLTLLAITVAAAYLNLGRFNTVVALGIAAVKALLILVFFMNLRQERSLFWLAAATGFFWLLLLFLLAMSDFMARA